MEKANNIYWGSKVSIIIWCVARCKRHCNYYRFDASFLLSLEKGNMTVLTMRICKWQWISARTNCEDYLLIIVVKNSFRPNCKPMQILAAVVCERELNLKRLQRAAWEKLLRYCHEYGCLDQTQVVQQRISGTWIANLCNKILEQQHPKQLQDNTEIQKKMITLSSIKEKNSQLDIPIAFGLLAHIIQPKLADIWARQWRSRIRVVRRRDRLRTYGRPSRARATQAYVRAIPSTGRFSSTLHRHRLSNTMYPWIYLPN